MCPDTRSLPETSLSSSAVPYAPYGQSASTPAYDEAIRLLRTTTPSGNGSRQPSRTVERDPRATTAQQCSKGLILLRKQTVYLSKALILHAHEIGTFCIDCTDTPASAASQGHEDYHSLGLR
jgi:hypothetical protein